MGATSIVYCETPIVTDRVVSFCGESKTGKVFPNTLGYAALNDAAMIVTSYWDNQYISVYTSHQTTSTWVYHAAWFTGNGCGVAVLYCADSMELFSATITYFTVYAPTGNIATVNNEVTTTVTTTETTTLLGTLTYTEATTATVTKTSTSVSVVLSTLTTTEVDTSTITNTVTEDGTCPAVDTKTVTTSVTYNIGTGNEITLYTSGLVPGTSTYYSCFD